MSKHHIEDVPNGVQVTVRPHATYGGKHRSDKYELEKQYPKFADNIRERLDRQNRAFEIAQFAGLASTAMQASGTKWYLEWTV